MGMTVDELKKEKTDHLHLFGISQQSACQYHAGAGVLPLCRAAQMHPSGSASSVSAVHV